MKLQGEINGEAFDLDVRRQNEKVVATVDGREYELEASEPEPGVFLLKTDRRVYEVFVSETEPKGTARVAVRGKEFEVTLVDPKRLSGARTDHAHGDGLIEIKTAMPGKVVRIILSVGDQVEKGAGVIVVEAMKMQNEMRSPRDGTIKEIRTAEGATVNAGDVLVIIE